MARSEWGASPSAGCNERATQADASSASRPKGCGPSQYFNSLLGLRLAGRRYCRGSAAAQFFKMKLVHTATVTLRNCNQVIVDLDLLALFRQVTKQMGDVTADGAHVRPLHFYVCGLVQLAQTAPHI